MALKYDFEKMAVRYAVAIDDDRFIDLEDAENLVIENAPFEGDNSTLREKLEKLDGISEVDYDSQINSFVCLSIEADLDSDELKRKIAQTIDDHLAWCAALLLETHAVP